MALEEFRIRFGKAMMELIGTAMLVMTIQLSVSAGLASAAFVIGLVLVAIVYAGGPVSGAHYNPAISLAVFLRGKISLHEMLVYWLFQVAGGVLGALLGGLIVGNFIAIAVGSGFSILQAFLAELVFTTLLCFTVLAVATNSKVDGNSYYGFAIGLVVLVGAATVGSVSGGAFNPAVVLGLVIVKHFWKLGYAAWVILADLLGGVCGALLFYLCVPEEFEHFGEEARALLEGQSS